MEITPQLLARVAQDNMRDHQIGEIKDGISWEVARDMGFIPVEEAAQLVPVVEVQPTIVQRRPTIAEQNANARRELAIHYKHKGEARRINLDLPKSK